MAPNFIPASELEAQESTEREALALAQKEAKLDTSSISVYLDKCWEDARSAKEQYIETTILNNMRQIAGKYDAEKLAAIKKIGGSEVYMMVTDAKCKNAAYWVADIMFQPGQMPFGIDPTPVPELPESVTAQIMEELFMSAMQDLMASAPQGMEPDPNVVMQAAQEALPAIEKLAKQVIVSKAKEGAKDAETEVNDKLVEGSWYEALKKVIPNVIMHTGFVKGPTLKRRTVTKFTPDEQGTMQVNAIDDVYPCYESRHPLFIYPSPDSTGIDDGYLFDREKITPSALQDLLGVPGYNDAEIEAVLSEITDHKNREWLMVDQEAASINKEQSPLFYDSSKLDLLNFWGAVRGEMLINWGLKVTNKNQPVEENKYYHIIAYKIGTHVIGISFNTNPLGKKNFYKASFEERDGSFWGRGLPEIIYDVQTVCNACSRAIVNNVGMASGPQVERNIDRIPNYARMDKALIPWKVWDTTTDIMSTAPAINFYQPPMVVERLMNVYNQFSKIADEHSGVPAFTHGDPNVGGAGNTSSGLSMLMGAAARGIRALVVSIDQNIIKPSVERQFTWSILNGSIQGIVCDYQIVASGSSAALLREQLAARRIEFMTNTNNPVDLAIIGAEGRKYLLEETAKSMQLDLSRIFPPQAPAPAMPQVGPDGKPLQGGAVPGANAQQLDQSGTPVAGTDNSGVRMPQRASGGPVSPNQPYLVGEGGGPEVFVPDQPKPITDPWGDTVTPGQGKPMIWAKLPTEDKAEDIMMVINGQRSFGPRKDAAFQEIYKSLKNNPVAAAEAMTEMMEGGKMPHFFMWESGNTSLPKYQKRQTGGPVDQSQPYMVGENGPEVFVPQSPGTIVPTDPHDRSVFYRKAGSLEREQNIKQPVGNWLGADNGQPQVIPSNSVLQRDHDAGPVMQKVDTRVDGTPKGNGFLGVLPMTDGSGKTATEISVGVKIDGRDVFIPSIVPTLSKEELGYLLAGGKPTKEIIDKAAAHALDRIHRGLSPFADR